MRVPIVRVPLELVLVVPLGDAAVPLTLSAPPLGAVESGLNVSVAAFVWFPAASAPVMISVGDDVVPALVSELGGVAEGARARERDEEDRRGVGVDLGYDRLVNPFG